MITEMQREKARMFLEMHKGKKMFMLPNVWDVGSAYVFEKQGFRAVATSSAGIAYDLGYPDGEDIEFEELLYVAEKIANRIDIPLSVDFERGYSEVPAQVKENARRLLLAGAVGFNIEDGMPDRTLNPLEHMLEKIEAISQLKQELGLDFVINARTCAYWLNVADEEQKMEIVISRGNAFAKAGADCVFIPGAIERENVLKLVNGINAPINIILNSAYHNLAGLEELGVRRLSVGSGPVRSIYARTIKLASDLYDGNLTELLENDFTYAKANDYFQK